MTITKKIKIMAHQIKVSKQVFNKMKNCGDWNETLRVLYDNTGETGVWDQDVHTDKSYQDDEKCVIVGARNLEKTIVTIEK